MSHNKARNRACKANDSRDLIRHASLGKADNSLGGGAAYRPLIPLKPVIFHCYPAILQPKTVILVRFTTRHLLR